jgi:hypothetical protein
VSRCYEIHGLVLDSSVPLPVDVASPEPSSSDRVRFRRSLRARPSVPALSIRADCPEAPWAIERWYPGYAIVEFPGWATFEVRPHEIALIEQVVPDDDLVSHLLLDHVVPRVVAIRGDLMLHAAGVVGPSGFAHMFMGPTGTGKSTLATSLALHGWPLLDDDGVRASFGDGRWSATPGYAGVRLLPDAVRMLAPGTSGTPMARGHQKLRLRVSDLGIRMAGGPAPIATAYVLGWDETECEPHTNDLGFAAGIRGIAGHAFHFSLDPSALTRSAFERSSSFASQVPVRELVQPSSSEDTQAVMELLAGLDAQIGD